MNLLDDKKRLQAIIDAMGDGVSIQDTDFRILYQNQNHKKLIGEHIGEYCYKAYEYQDKVCEGCPVAMSFKDNKVHMVERSAATEKGIFHVEITASPLLDEEGNIIAGIEIVGDITNRKKIEGELNESEKRYKKLTDSVTDYIYTVKVENGHAVKTYHGPGCVAVTGYTSGEYETDRFLWFNMVHDEDKDKVREHAEKVISGQAVSSIEHRIIYKNGHVRWVKNTPVQHFDEKGFVTAYDALISDITERKITEDALKASEKKYRDLVDNASVGVYQTNLKGDILYVNQALLSIFEFESPEEMMSFGVLARYKNPKDREGFIEMLKKAGNVKDFESEVFTRSGKIRTVILSASLDREFISGMLIDITERKKADDELRESEARFRRLSNEFQALLDAIPDILTLLSPELKVIWSNRSYSAALGKETDYVINRYCYELWHNRTEPCDPCPVQRSFRTGNAEIEVVPTPDGRLWDLRTFPLKDEDGIVNSVIEVGRDITEHRKLEEQLRQSQKMEAVGQLAGGVAHDFNNILTAIIGYGNLMQMKIKEDDPLRVHIEQILSSSERAANLIRSLLAFSRKQIMNPKPLNLNEIVERVTKLLSRLIGEDIELKIVLTDRALTVMADSSHIEQVLMNLATNARDAMPNGGSLTIETEAVNIDEEFIKAHAYGKPGEYALISISDTGAGMDEKTKDKIFEPFFTTKEVGKGTGLGLAMVYGIIKQHDGYIHVYSEPNEGTTFRIYLPVIESEVEEIKQKDLQSVEGGTETVLVAEDDASVRGLIKDMLGRYGYNVITAEDGEDAVKKFSENRGMVQLLLFDVIMPRKNGKEAYTEIKKIKSDIKVIFISGYTADIIHKKGILEEGLNFILKPISKNNLLRKVREVLDKDR